MPTSVDSTKSKGDKAEDRALHYLQRAGLRLLARNYRTPGRGGGEIDLIMQEKNGTVVFIEVRQRHNTHFGGAAASVSLAKQKRILFAAQHFLVRHSSALPCRMDVVTLENDALVWLQGAFEQNAT